MKKLYAFALLMGGSLWAGAQTYAVDFAVDINAVNPNQDTVIIAGDFAAADASGQYTNWNDGGNADSAVYAVDPDMDGIWTFTANLPDGSYQYKFLNGVGGWESVANRTFTVSGAAVQLDTFCYDVLTPGVCPSTYADTLDITIQIDMSTICGFDPATDILDFAGEPNGWSGDTMADPDGDLVYEITYTDLPVQVEFSTGLATFQGKCRINSDWGTSEGGANRVFEFGSDTILPVRCYGAFAYGACTPIPDPATVTFRVDMSAEVPAGDGKIFVMGDFTSWQDGALEMLDNDGDNVYEVVVPNFCPPEIYFKFINGTPDQQGGTGAVEESADFSDIGGCGVDNGSFSDNRYLARPTDGNDVIIEFAFNTCDGIQGGVSVEEFSKETLYLTPNPMGERAVVQLPEGNFNGQIVDLTGRVMRTFTDAATELVIERDGLNTGVYMLVLTNEKGETNTTKFVVR